MINKDDNRLFKHECSYIIVNVVPYKIKYTLYIPQQKL